MALIDHLGITVDDLPGATARFDAILQELGCTRHDADGSVAWDCGDETELILFPAREPGTGPHVHGRVGWQHLAFTVDSGIAGEEDRLRAAGVDITMPLREEPWGERLFQITDPNGVVVQFVEWAAPAT